MTLLPPSLDPRACSQCSQWPPTPSPVWESITGVTNMVMNTVHAKYTARKFLFLSCTDGQVFYTKLWCWWDTQNGKKRQTIKYVFMLAGQLLAICISSFLCGFAPHSSIRIGNIQMSYRQKKCIILKQRKISTKKAGCLLISTKDMYICMHKRVNVCK